MIGASRGSLARAQASLSARQGDLSTLSAELFAVVAAIANEKSLRQTLADSGQPEGARKALITDLLGNKVSAATLEVLGDIVTARWSSDHDLIEAIETVASQAAFASADKGGTLDRVEDEVFLFGRAIDASPELQMALTDPSLGAEAKAAIVGDLLGGKVDSVTLSVVKYYASNLRGRRVDAVVAELSDLAGEARNQSVAEVRSVVALDESQTRRLAAALSVIAGREVKVNVAIDPTVLGGISVKIGDQVIDGTVASRLENARRSLLA